jgi:TFIIF-interacting CTD phosphatase-like protein
MDETLIHAKFFTSPEQEKNDDGDFIVSLASMSGHETAKISVKMRPFLDSCLEHLAKMYEIAVFTAGEQSYADAVLDYLDENR